MILLILECYNTTDNSSGYQLVGSKLTSESSSKNLVCHNECDPHFHILCKLQIRLTPNANAVEAGRGMKYINPYKSVHV